MSTFVLKLIAITAMLIDHIGAILFPDVIILRIIGRIAFPIFVFLLVEGFYHTKNYKKYLTRLGVFALISELPFDIGFYRYLYGEDFFGSLREAFSSQAAARTFIGRLLQHQNVFFTLFIGLILIYLLKMIETKYKEQILVSNILDALLTVAFCAIALFMRVDYDLSGILMIVAFYLFRGSKGLITITLFILNGTLFRFNNAVTIQAFSILSMIPIAFYNGKKGKDIKYLFYAFYPVHILLLYFISLAI